MRKPTPSEFFAIEALVWVFLLFLIGAYTDWSGRQALAIFFIKASCLNVGVAIFNVVGTCINMACHWWPWEDRKST